MKRVFIIALAVIMTMGLAACGSSPAPASAPPASAAPASAAPASAPPASTGGNEFDPLNYSEPIELIWASQSTSSSDYADGGVICSLLNTKGTLPDGSRITQKTISSGSSTTGYLIMGGEADIARGQNVMPATEGVGGRPPYSGICALFGAGSNGIVLQVAAPDFVKKTGYETLEEAIENKYPVRVCCEEAGSSDYACFIWALEIYGYTLEDFQGWGGTLNTTDTSTASEMIQDGQADIMFMHSNLTAAVITELCLTTDVTLHGINQKLIDGFLAKGLAPRTIPEGTFGKFTEDEYTVYIGTSIIVGEDMPDEVAYLITKACMENRDELGELAATMRAITNENAVSQAVTVVPLHPGAVKYFQDIGVLDAAGKYIPGA